MIFHILLMLHCPQQLKDGSSEYIPLSDLGYILVLGHSSTVIFCSEDSDLFGDRWMTLVHANGVFEHYVKFCKCNNASSEHKQLFIHRLFPSTSTNPKLLLLLMFWNILE